PLVGKSLWAYGPGKKPPARGRCVPVARVQRPVSAPASVGAERSPLATSARRGSGDPHREKSHWDFSRPSCAVFSGTQGRGTLSLLTCRFGQALNGRHRRPAPLQAFCKKLDQKLFVSLYRTRLGKPSPKTPVSERSERIGVFPAPRGHAPRPTTDLG